MAGGQGFVSHVGVTLSRGWLCQKWEPLDIPGARLHHAVQLVVNRMPTSLVSADMLSLQSE